MHVYNVFYDGKSQTGSSGMGGAGLLDPVELVKYQRKLLRRDHVTVVGHGNLYRIGIGHDLHQDPFALRAVLDGIADQIVKQAGQKVAVRRDDLGRHIALKLIGKPLVGKVRIGLLQKLP